MTDQDRARPRLWTSAETAAFLGISEKTLRTRRMRGASPPYIKDGRSVRYAPADVGQWLRERTVTPAPPARAQVIA